MHLSRLKPCRSNVAVRFGVPLGSLEVGISASNRRWATLLRRRPPQSSRGQARDGAACSVLDSGTGVIRSNFSALQSGGAKMARTGESMCLTVLLVIVMAMGLDRAPRAVQAQQFGVIHKYAHLEGSRANSGDEGVSRDYFETLKAHDRRRLATVLDLPLNGSYITTGLYYTQLSLGTPPRQYSVMMDTGSHITWVDCAPCTNCPTKSNIPGVTLTQYDPKSSSTDKALPCTNPECRVASTENGPMCTDPVSPGACVYEILYVDGSSTGGYLLSDVMTYNAVVNGTNTVSTASVYFGCGHNQTGTSASGTGVDGLMGFGQAAISIPSQLASQNKTGRVFAHCLQGDSAGGGIFVIGNITEPNIVYTPIVPSNSLYNVGMQNIAVNGTNITTPASFDLRADGTGGAVVDSGTTTALLIQPAYDQFQAALSQDAPVPLQQIKDQNGDSIPCFVYSGSIDETFPKVKLFFDGGAVMNLGPTNYLIPFQLDNGGTAYCIAWSPSTDYTLLGDIVLQDQLIVYDNEKQRIGWKPFDCTNSISVNNGTTPTAPSPAQAPVSTTGGGRSSGAQDSRTRMSTYLLSSWLAFAFLLTLL